MWYYFKVDLWKERTHLTTIRDICISLFSSLMIHYWWKLFFILSSWQVQSVSLVLGSKSWQLHQRDQCVGKELNLYINTYTYIFTIMLVFTHIPWWVILHVSFKSYTNPKRFIVTKYPRRDDAVDFLRLLNDHESLTVVCMDPVYEIDSVQSILCSAKDSHTIYLMFIYYFVS